MSAHFARVAGAAHFARVAGAAHFARVAGAARMARFAAALVVRFAAALVAVVVALAPHVAFAQRAEVSVTVDSDVVEVGAELTYTQKVTVHGDTEASSPKPGALPGFSLRGVTSSPMRMRTVVNGVVDDMQGLVTAWTLRADKKGIFTLGPSEITVGGTRRKSAAVSVRVVERGQSAPRSRGGSSGGGGGRNGIVIDPFGANPLDPFKGLFDFGDETPRAEPVIPATDPKLSLATPRAPVAFLHATIDKTRAVVGEQVALSVFLYEDLSADPRARQNRPGDVHEPVANDFVKRSLLEDDAHALNVGTALVGGTPWSVKLVRKSALFPLKAGHLTIEPMSLTLGQGSAGLRASETLSVDVTEPPLAGRPPGYMLGDVGDMALNATVTPSARRISRDDAVEVTLELRGTGNLPAALTVPAPAPSVSGGPAAVEWLEPQVRDKLGVQQNDKYGGTRTFSYIVRLHKEGAVDLGDVRLPYFNAEKRAYSVARANLGIVNVDGASKPARENLDKPEPILEGLPSPRRTLEGRRNLVFVADRKIFWFVLLGSPWVWAIVLGARYAWRRYASRRASRAALPNLARDAQKRHEEARAACRGNDGKAMMHATARVIEAEVLARTHVNVRGSSREVAKTELEAAGLENAMISRLFEFLGICEKASFSPENFDFRTAQETWQQAETWLATWSSHPREARRKTTGSP